MKIIHASWVALLIGAMLAGCSQQHGSVNGPAADKSGESKFGNVEIKSGRVWLKADDGSTATIDANGDLAINDKSIALTEKQRALTQRYFKQTMIAGTQIAAVAAAGAAAAHEVKDSVVNIIFDREPNEAEKNLYAKLDKVNILASKLCDRATELASTQAAIVAEIPAFAPFATTTKCARLQMSFGHAEKKS